MQAPLHSFMPLGQAATQARPLQVTVPPLGAWQGVHDVLSVGPQVATAPLLTHFPAQVWKPLLHLRAHAPATQAAVPLGSVGQLTQVVPQPVASSSGAQRAPQRWVPEPQAKSHAVPSQVAALAPVGLGQTVQEADPQLSVLVFAAQMPAQLCEPAGQTPEQAAVAAMQAPAQGFMPVGQAGRQAVPSHVTEPPVGIWQAMHEVGPQLPTSRLLTHRPPQM